MQLGWLRRLLGVCHSAMQALLRRQDGSVGRDLHLERLRWLLTMLCAAAALATTDVINAAVRTAAALSGTARRFTAADITNAMPTLCADKTKPWAELCTWVGCGGCYGCFAASQRSAASQSSDAPNLVLILVDDLAYGDFGCYGGTMIPTPNIDTLAAGGIRFSQAYAVSPVCGPSRVALRPRCRA